MSSKACRFWQYGSFCRTLKDAEVRSSDPVELEYT